MKRSIYIFAFVVLGLIYPTAKAQMLLHPNYGMRGYMYGGEGKPIHSDTSIIRAMASPSESCVIEKFFEYSTSQDKDGTHKRWIAIYDAQTRLSNFSENLDLYSIDYDITDMEVLGNVVYFCGNDLDGNSVFGMISPNVSGNPYNIKVWRWTNLPNSMIFLPKKMDLYRKDGFIHLIAVGDCKTPTRIQTQSLIPTVEELPHYFLNSFIVDLILSDGNNDVQSTHLLYNTKNLGNDGTSRFEDVTVCQNYVVIAGHRTFNDNKPNPNVVCYPKTSSNSIFTNNWTDPIVPIHQRMRATKIPSFPETFSQTWSSGSVMNRWYNSSGIKYSDRVVLTHGDCDTFYFSAGACCSYDDQKGNRQSADSVYINISHGISCDAMNIKNDTVELVADCLIETDSVRRFVGVYGWQDNQDKWSKLNNFFDSLDGGVRCSLPKDIRIQDSCAYVLFDYFGHNSSDEEMNNVDVLYDVNCYKFIPSDCIPNTSYIFNKKYIGFRDNSYRLCSMMPFRNYSFVVSPSAVVLYKDVYLSGFSRDDHQLIWWKAKNPSINLMKGCGTTGEVLCFHHNHKKSNGYKENIDVYTMEICTICQTKEIIRYDHNINTICGDSYNPKKKVAPIEKSGSTQPLSSLKIYPNPADEVINIQSDKEISRVIILDQNEQEVMMKDVQGFGTTLNVSGVKPGIYFVKIITNEGCEIHRVSIK